MEYKQHLLNLLGTGSISKILEIGVYKGDFAVKMLNTLYTHNPKFDLQYVGIDLFELMNDEILKKENSLVAPTMSFVKKFIEEKCPYATIALHKGFSKDILPILDLFEFDLIYIDGGHSIETIEVEWTIINKGIKDNCIVVFDDYYEGRLDIGAKKIIDSIDKNNFSVAISNGKEYDTEIGTLIVKQAFVQRKTKFDKSDYIGAKDVILEKIDNKERNWEIETQNTIEFIKPFLQKDFKVLDFGCGVGRLSLPLAEHVNFVYGVDKSNDMLRIAERQRLDRNTINAKFIDLDFFLSNEILKFDLIICVFVLQHIPKHNLEIIFNKFRLSAKPDARILVINTPTRFVVNGNEYFDDKVDIRELLNDNFIYVENLGLDIIGREISEHHFSAIYKLKMI